MVLARLQVGINIVFSPQESLDFFNSCIELDPIPTLGQLDSLISYATDSKPIFDRSNRIP